MLNEDSWRTRRWNLTPLELPLETLALLGAGVYVIWGAFSGNVIQAAALSGLACFFGIAARISQARIYHKELLKRLEALCQPKPGAG
jgi:hypothetical protein